MSRLAHLAGLLLSLTLAVPLTAQEGTEPPPELSQVKESTPKPDRIVLKNGDVLTGTIVVMGKGKLTLKHPLVGDMEVKFDDIADIVTGQAVTLKTEDGEIFKRRVVGIEDGQLQLADPGPDQVTVGALPRGQLSDINPPAKKPAEWTGAVSLGVDMSTGNTDSRTVNMNADAKRRADNDRITGKAIWIYDEEKTGGQWNLIDRIVRGQLKYDYFLTKKFYAMTNMLAGADDSAGLDLRFTVGAGPGYQWFEEKDLELFTEVSVQYVNEQYDDPAQDSDYLGVRAAYGFTWTFLETATFHNDGQLIQSTDNRHDVWALMDTYLRMAVAGPFFGQVRWILEYDNTPNPGDDRVDNTYLLQFGWNF